MNEIRKSRLGDVHFGESVELIDDGTTKYLLKPRGARVEKAMEAFLSALGQKGFPFLPLCEHVIEAEESWFKSALIEHLPAENKNDKKIFFHRCGATIFLTHILHSNDLHHENIIAKNNTPVIIDLETICNGLDDYGYYGKLSSLTSTVLHSHFLPVQWKWIVKKHFQISGLYADLPQINRNMLYYNGEICQPYDHLDEITEGFVACYNFAMNHRDFLREAVSLFEGCHFRKIIRPTDYYAKFVTIVQKFPEDKRRMVAETLLAEAHKRDKREGRLEFMRRALDCEVDAVVRGDIPHFTSLYESRDLYCGGENVRTDFLRLSPRECVLNRLDSLSEEDCEAQKRIIIQSVDAVRPIKERVPLPYSDSDPIRAAYHRLEDGCISVISTRWMMLEAAQNNNLYLQNAGWGLYSGLTGILCAYAAFYHRTGERMYLDALLRHYRDFGAFIDSIERKIPLSDSSGRLQDAPGGMLNALLHIHELTGERVFYGDAVRLAEKLEPTFEGECGDLLGGAAGLALSLPKLPQRIAEPLAKALLPKLAAYEPTLTGAAHGAAGVALAIAAAQKALSTHEHDTKIIKLISFEEKYFDADKNNWRDLRDESRRDAFMNGWCSGAGGVAMTRKRLMSLTDNEEIRALCRRDIARAAENLGSDLLLKRDSLCCGNASRLMAASCIGVKNDRLYEHLCKALCADTLTLVHLNDTCDHLYGLMQGVAGAGYAVAMCDDEKSGGMLL